MTRGLVLALLASSGCVLPFTVETTVGPFVRNVRVAGDALEVERCDIQFSHTEAVVFGAIPGAHGGARAWSSDYSGASLSSQACVTERVGFLAADDDTSHADSEPEEGPQ